MTKINFKNRAHWNMFTANKEELIDVYNNIVERFDLNDTNYILQHETEIRISVNYDGAFLLWYYPKDIEEVDNRSAKTCFQYKIDLYKDKGMINPRFMIHFDEPSFYEYEADSSGKTIVVKNKKLNMTITHRNSVYENGDDVYKAFIDWYDKVRKDVLKARIEAI